MQLFKLTFGLTQQGKRHLNRQRAVALLREILEVTNESIISSISLIQDTPGVFSLKIDGNIGDSARNRISPILAREKLAMKLDKGILIIY